MLSLVEDCGQLDNLDLVRPFLECHVRIVLVNCRRVPDLCFIVAGDGKANGVDGVGSVHSGVR
jgi:hypothetical protein